MTAPRLEIDLDKIYHNARSLVERLASQGIRVTGVLKSTLGSTAIASVLIRAGRWPAARPNAPGLRSPQLCLARGGGRCKRYQR